MIHLRPRLAIAASSVLILCGSHRFFAREAPSQETSGTKQSAEARLKAVAKPKASGAAQDVIDTLSATHRFEQAAISPDGKKVAWVEDIITKHGVSTGDTVIYVADIGGKNPPKRISAAVADAIHAEGSVAWSPDSKKLAFLSDAAKAGQLQLYIMDAAGPSGSARKLTQVKGFLSSPGWSPSGKTIAVLFTENATRAAGPLSPKLPKPAKSRTPSSSSASPSSMLPPVSSTKFLPPTPTSTNTIGRPTASTSPSPPPSAMATTIGTSPSSTLSTPPQA